MKLQTRITVPVIIIVALIIAGLTGVSYFFAKQLLDQNLKSLTMDKTEEVRLLVEVKNQEVLQVKDDLNKGFIEKARAVSFVIQQNPAILTDMNALNRLAKSLDVEEIHVTDGQGVLLWGTVPGFYGFDFKTTDQTKPFMQIIDDPSLEMAQDPSERGTDKVLFQYISVARLDQPGIVQVGVRPERLAEAMKKADLGTLSQSVIFGKTGYVFIVDKATGNILSHKDAALIGKPLADLGIDQQLTQGEKGNFKVLINGKEQFFNFISTGPYIISATIETSEFTGGLKNLLMNMSIIAVMAIVILVAVVILLLRTYVIREIGQLIDVLHKIGKGNLSQFTNIKSSFEMKELSDGINDMTNNLKGVVLENIHTTDALKSAATHLSDSATESSKGCKNTIQYHRSAF